MVVGLITIKRRSQKRIHIIRTIDGNGFNWLVWAVASSGFFTDSYNLFATNAILPALSYVYWPENTKTHRETNINIMTLTGSIVGQLTFGYLADRYGRTQLYGIELIIVIVSTLGVAQSSTGVGGSMSITASLMAWRFLMGIGIGAEYPLSAVITAEWSSVSSRARMLAAVFLMQPVGQLFAYLVCFWALIGLDDQFGLQESTDYNKSAHIVDKLWRIVIAVGAIPALIAILFRLTITDPGRYTLDVKDKADQAVEDTNRHFGSHESDDTELQGPAPADEPLPAQFSWGDIKQYLIIEGNWRYLAGTSLCWAILDFAFFGLGIGNPQILAKLWAFSEPPPEGRGTPSWNPDHNNPNATIYTAVRDNAERSMITISIGATLGTLLLIKLIDYIPRKKILAWSFLWMAILLAVTGGMFFKVAYTDSHTATIVLYALCEFSFNLGPNTLLFILPAEIFPTRYRCTCHGIAAASGKLGSVIVQAILPAASFHGVKVQDPNSKGLGWILIIYSVVMASGALFAWAWIPDVQDMRREEDSLVLPSKSLEELAEGRVRAQKDGQIIGLRRKVFEFFSRFGNNS
ncbi:MFS general substrate transporter [Lepidopterella palustris CBS 459.81]|uniref:MFS general substrate transporter n=1 Tax=Lepidopterella palustris CBS 459.81 TaxID=1314670 RepID=A0A8E2JAN5_9PEZI|nr:MFS general substrate transporter [Lepidopterella palustris CBS 459.81]